MRFGFNELTSDALIDFDCMLWPFVDDPQKLERERERFDKSPPYCHTPPNLNALGFTSPSAAPAPETPQSDPFWWVLTTRRRRELELEREYCRSKPYQQLHSLMWEEDGRIQRGTAYTKRNNPIGVLNTQISMDRAKQRWVDQGIWDDAWRFPRRRVRSPNWKWKHQQPPAPEGDLDRHAKGKSKDCSGDRPDVPRQAQQTDGQAVAADQGPVPGQHREASRPFFQFMYQVSLERSFIEERLNDPGYNPDQFPEGWRPKTPPRVPPPANVNSMAYITVKKRWKKRGVWDPKWGDMLPGMSWTHEQPLENYLWDEMGGDIPKTPPGPVTRPSSINGFEPRTHWLLVGDPEPPEKGEVLTPVFYKQSLARPPIPWDVFGLSPPKKRRNIDQEKCDAVWAWEMMGDFLPSRPPSLSEEERPLVPGGNQQTDGDPSAVSEWLFQVTSPDGSVDQLESHSVRQQDQQGAHSEGERLADQLGEQPCRRLEDQTGELIGNRAEGLIDQPGSGGQSASNAGPHLARSPVTELPGGNLCDDSLGEETHRLVAQQKRQPSWPKGRGGRPSVQMSRTTRSAAAPSKVAKACGKGGRGRRQSRNEPVSLKRTAEEEKDDDDDESSMMDVEKPTGAEEVAATERLGQGDGDGQGRGQPSLAAGDKHDGGTCDAPRAMRGRPRKTAAKRGSKMTLAAKPQGVSKPSKTAARGNAGSAAAAPDKREDTPRTLRRSSRPTKVLVGYI